MLVISKMDYHFFARFAVPAYRGILYLYVSGECSPAWGSRSTAQKRWLGLGPCPFQPTELVKVTVILVLAVVITRLGKKIDEWRSWGMLIVLIAPLALMVMANNLSSGLIIMGIGFVMMFIACKKKWIFILSMALGAAVFIFAPMIAMGLEKAGILESYQLSRILVWQNPEAYPMGRRLPGAPGALRHRLRRPSGQGAGTEHPEAGLPSGAPERYDLCHHLRGAGPVRGHIGDPDLFIHDLPFHADRWTMRRIFLGPFWWWESWPTLPSR